MTPLAFIFGAAFGTFAGFALGTAFFGGTFGTRFFGVVAAIISATLAALIWGQMQ